MNGITDGHPRDSGNGESELGESELLLIEQPLKLRSGRLQGQVSSKEVV